MARVELRQLTKRFGPVEAVHALDLTIEDRDFMVLVGPSGCGKSTVLRMIAGLERPTSGSIRIDDQPVDHLPPKDRDVAMVFQSYALYPHMTVYDNMAFGLRLHRVPRSEIRRRVERAAGNLDLLDYLDRKPAALSGGQRQRVALGRAIVREPRVFLFDEPLSNLDAKLRNQTRAELVRLHRQLRATMIYVTHDQTEAMTMGSHIAALDGGVLQQVDHPLRLYQRPCNLFVAGFIGSPGMNLFSGTIADGTFESDALRFELPVAVRPAARPSTRVTFGIRPEDLGLQRAVPAAAERDREAGRRSGTAGAGALAVVRGRTELTEPLGAETYVHVRVGQRVVTVRVSGAAQVEAEEEVELRFDPAAGHFFDTGNGERLL